MQGNGRAAAKASVRWVMRQRRLVVDAGRSFNEHLTLLLQRRLCLFHSSELHELDAEKLADWHLRLVFPVSMLCMQRCLLYGNKR